MSEGGQSEGTDCGFFFFPIGYTYWLGEIKTPNGEKLIEPTHVITIKLNICGAGDILTICLHDLEIEDGLEYEHRS